MAYRMFDTTTWADPWFKQLSEPAKLLFIYLWTNERCNAAGMYRLDKQIMGIESGLNGHDPDSLLAELNKSIAYDDAEEVIWVKNFFRRQCQNASFCKSAIKALKSLPEAFGAKFCQYNSKTLKCFEIKPPSWHGGDTVLTAQHSTETEQSITFSKEKEVFNLPNGEEINESSKSKIHTDLEEVCKQLKPTWSKVFAFKNKMLKEGKNPRAVLHALCRCYMKQKFDDQGPWAYCIQILKAEDGNYNERDYQKNS